MTHGSWYMKKLFQNPESGTPPDTTFSRYTDLILSKEYKAYVVEYNRRIARLYRELRGISVPGDYDGGY